MNTLIKLWADDGGFIVSVELLLILTLLVFGVVGGLVILRDAVNDQFLAIANTVRGLDTGFAVPALGSRTGASNGFIHRRESVGNQVFDAQAQTEFGPVLLTP